MEKLPARTLDLVRRLRRDATDAAQLLWRVLRDRSPGGFKFRRQKAFPPYVVDFYCAEKRLALEVDGGQQAAADIIEHDQKRSAHLASLGVRVLRFWNNEVTGEPEKVLESIWLALTSEIDPARGHGEDRGYLEAPMRGRVDTQQTMLTLRTSEQRMPPRRRRPATT